MPNRSIWYILLFGGLAITGIVFIQTYLVFKTYDIKEQDFHLTVEIALRKVANAIGKYNDSELPKTDLILRRSSNLYSVNVNSAIDANVLEDFLIQEFEKHSLSNDFDFEYAVYDCANDELVYGNYCKLNEESEEYKRSDNLPKFNDLVYYFVVKFPSKESYLLGNMRQTILFSLIALLSVLFFIYAIWVILRQKQLTELQKDFINNMTHEFKTPISSIKIASDVLLGNDVIKNDQRLHQYSKIINDQNKRLNRQVEKVLNIARLERDQFKLNLTKINLDEFLKNLVEEENLKIENQGGKIYLNTDNPNFFIEADQLHLVNVITNILDNAIKYCETKPIITISTSVNNSSYILKIMDNGIGIGKDEHKKLFNKFYRVPTGNVHNVKGFGLGLFYVKNICDEHHWELSLDSQLEKGTTVQIIFPEMKA